MRRLGAIDPDRLRGAFLGLAVGDAVGTTLEFQAPGSFEPLTDMVGGGPFGTPPGTWTDDTAMAACLAESLIACGGFDPADQMRRYLRWYREGYWSATGHCFDIGTTTRAALEAFAHTADPWSGSCDPHAAGNGCIMRLAPVPLAYAHDPATAIHLAGESSRTTHGARTCVDACRYLAGLIVGAVRGVPKDELLAPRYTPVPGLWDEQPLDPAIDAVAAGSFTAKQPPDIRGSGYVVASLEAALWAFATSDDYQAAVLAAANLGDDADTTAAIAGQIAGASHGMGAIPNRWIERLALRQDLLALADRLVHLRT